MTEQQYPHTDAIAKVIGIVALVFFAWFFFFRGDSSSDPVPNRPAPAAHVAQPTIEPTIEHKLAVVNGDGPAVGEAEFSRILDTIQRGGGVCDPEPNREHVGDVIVASWQNSAQRDTLLEWARALAAVCGD